MSTHGGRCCSWSSSRRWGSETWLVTLDGAGSVGELSLTGVTLPDGAAGELAALRPAGPNRWTYDPTATVGRKPAAYTSSFKGVSRLHGREATCTAEAVVTRQPRGAAWIVRGYGARIDAGGSPYRESSGPLDFPERSKIEIGNGSGFGLGLEYLFMPRLGVELSALSGNLDAHYELDRAEGWGMTTRDLGFTPLSLGLNYHLTPERRVDVYLGAFVSQAHFDSVTFRALGDTRKVSFDSDTAAGIAAGADVPFTADSAWMLSLGLRYMPSDAASQGFKLEIDPLITFAGIGYRF